VAISGGAGVVFKTKTALACLAVSALAFTNVEAREARVVPVSASPVLWNWTGFYLGAHLGAGFNTSKVDNPYGPSIYGDTIRLPGGFAGLQGGYNWQGAGSPWVFGVEADVSAVNADGTNTCLAYSGQFVSANCRARQQAMGSITGRVGRTISPDGRTLVYIKGGAAFTNGDLSLTTNAPDYILQPSSERQDTRWGWTLGAGLEHAITGAWSVKAEYAYANFGHRDVMAPGGGFLMTPFDPGSLVNTTGLPTRASLDSHLVRLGLNYHLGRGPGPGEGMVFSAPARPQPAAWHVEVGARYWYSHGRYQNDLAMNTNMAQQNHLISRLTYESTGHSGEIFWRADGPRGFFLKGFAGGGGLTSGHMNDEDWFPTDPGGAMAYSNTYHGKVTGKIAYVTFDAGVDLLGDAANKIGVFAGYNFYRDRKDSFGCAQIALPDARSICGVHMPLTSIAISQYEDWHSLRVGVNGTLTVAPGLKLNVDAAYLPYAHVTALDIHHHRTEMPSPKSPAWGVGQGVQLEAILGYDISPRWTVGIGGRYWAMWSSKILTAGFGSATATEALPIRVERYGTFLQASYKFGTP